MADNDKARIEIEVAVKDSFSTALKEMGKYLDVMNKKTLEMGSSAGGAEKTNVGFAKLKRTSEELSGSVEKQADGFAKLQRINEAIALGTYKVSGGFEKLKKINDEADISVKKSNVSFLSMRGIFEGISGLLGSPVVGIAALLYGATKAMDTFAASSAQLKNLSVDTGIAIKGLSELQQTLERMGKSKEEALSTTATFASVFQDLRYREYQSGIGQKLLQRPGGADLIDRWIKMSRSGATNEELLEDAQKTYQKQPNQRSKEAFSSDFGLPESAFKDYEKNKAKNIEETLPNIEAYDEFRQRRITTDTMISNWWTSLKNNLMVGSNSLDRSIEDAFKPMGTPNAKVWDRFSPVTPGDPSKEQEFKEQWLKTHPGPRSDLGTHGDITDFSSRGRTHSGDDFRSDKEVSLLQDMRDSLLRIEDKNLIMDIGGGGSGSGGGNIYGKGARGGALQAGLGGFRRAGVVGARSGDVGVGARGGALQGSLGGFRRGSHGGNAEAAEAAGGGADVVATADAGGINRDKWFKELQDNPALKEELFRRSLGENTDPLANQAIMEEAANRADIRGNRSFGDKSNLSYFQGYYRGPISSKMQTMLDSNFQKVFSGGSDISKGAIDNSSQGLAYVHEHGGQMGQYGRPGLPPGRFRTTANFGGDRITGHHGVESFEVPGWGESGGGERDRYPAFRQHQLEEAAERRERLDKSQSMNGGVWGKGAINAKVDFLNVPSGVKTSAETDGDMFKDLEVHRTKSQSRMWEPPGGIDQ